MSEFKLNEAEVLKLNLQPGEVLIVTVKSDELDQHSMNELRQGLIRYFPNNKVIVLGTGSEGSISLTVAKTVSYDEPVVPKVEDCSTVNYCSTCACGKKEAYEAQFGSGEGETK